MRSPLLFACLIVFFQSCSTNEKTFENNNRISKLGVPLKVEYFESIHGSAFAVSDSPLFIINDEAGIERIMSEIREGEVDGPWKGAGWDRISIYYADTTVNLNTNGKVYGTSASGTFYALPKDNFINRNLNKPLTSIKH